MMGLTTTSASISRALINKPLTPRLYNKTPLKSRQGADMKKILIPLAQGFEEAEFIGIADVCKRAKEAAGKLEVLIASLTDELLVRGANGIGIQADLALKQIDLNSLDAIAMPGGFEGMQNLKNNPLIIETIRKLHSQGKLVAAICASPIVLHHAGVIEGEFTCYPGCESGIPATRLNQAVVKRGNVITSAGPATAILFGLEIVRCLCGQSVYENLYDGLLLPLTK